MHDRLPRNNAEYRLVADKFKTNLALSTFVEPLGWGSNSDQNADIPTIVASAIALCNAVDAYNNQGSSEFTRTAVRIARTNFKEWILWMYIQLGASLRKSVAQQAYVDLGLHIPGLPIHDPTEEATSFPLKTVFFHKAPRTVTIELVGDSEATSSKALPAHGQRTRLDKIGIVDRNKTTITDADLNYLHKEGNDHAYNITLAAHHGDKKIVIVSCYINRLGQHGPDSPPVFLILPNWDDDSNNSGNNDTKKKSSDEGEKEDEGDE